MPLQHGQKATQSYTKLISQTRPKDGRPGKNRSIVVGMASTEPVVLVSQKPPSKAIGELRSMSKTPGEVKILSSGKVSFEEGEVRIKTAKPANEGEVKKAFLGYYSHYKASPPSRVVRIVKAEEGEVEFAEDPADQGGDDPNIDAEAGPALEAIVAQRSAALATAIDGLVGLLKKSAATAAANPAAVGLLKNASVQAAAARKCLADGQLDQAEAALKALGDLMAQVSRAAPAAVVTRAGLSPARPPSDDPSVAFKMALSAAKWELDSVKAIPGGTPVTNGLRDACDAARQRMAGAAAAGDFAAATVALNDAKTAARRLNLAFQAAPIGQQRQLAAQTKLHGEMAPLAGEIFRTYFNPNAAAGSARIRQEDLSPETEFNAYTAALSNLETLKSANPPALPAQLKTAAQAVASAAQAYLARYDRDPGAGQMNDAKSLHKKGLCEEGMKAARHYAIALDIQGLGAPSEARPWTEDQQIRATQLAAQISFETGYKKGASLSAEGAAGVNASYWVERAPPGSAKAVKSFIFKPLAPADDSDRKDTAAKAAKESLASASAKLLERQTGIQLGVPETSVATIGNYALDLPADRPGNQPGGAQIGSLQQFEKTDGELISQKPGLLRRIPAEDCQKMALNDIIGINIDRHPGNFLVRTGAGGAPALVPIDHGENLPALDDLKQDATLWQNFAGLHVGGSDKNKGAVKNALLSMPGAYEKFSQDMQDRISLIDPEAIDAGRKAHLQALDRTNPGLDATGSVDPDSLTVSKRMLQFVKQAAPMLSPAEIQVAIAQNHQIFTDFGRDIGAAAQRIIAAAAPKGPGYAEFFTAPLDQRRKIILTLEANGWANADALIMQDPVAMLKLYKTNMRKPDAAPATVATAAEAAAGVSAIDLIDANIGRLLKDVRVLLPDANAPDRATLTERYRALTVQAASADADAPAVENQARSLWEDVIDSVLLAIRERGEALYAASIGNVRDEKNKDVLRQIYERGFLPEVGFHRSIAGARKQLADMEKIIASNR